MAADKDYLRQMAMAIRDEYRRGANTANRVGSLLVAICEELSLTPDELEKLFLRKDKDDTAKGVITFEKQIKSKDFVQGDLMGAGWSVYRDQNGNTVVETDKMVVRQSLIANELIVNQETFEKGSSIYVKGGCTITNVEEYETYYRCFYDNESGKRYSGFKKDDQARCQRYDSSYSQVIKYYWRLVVEVGENYVDLSKVDFDGHGVPEVGDDIAQLGNRSDASRQSAVVVSPDNGGSVVIWAGINSFNLSQKNMVGMGVNPNTGRSYLYGYGDMFFGDRSLEKNYITYQTRNGETEPTLNINADIHFGKGSDGLSNLSEFKDIQKDVDNLFGQIEREFTIWYYDYEPTLDNEPAVNWVTDSDKALHDQDIFFSDKLARAWRFVNGAWVEITDERTLAALKISEDAKSDAEDAKKNAEEAKKQATAAANRVANVEYLKDTFGKNETVVDGGVYISKLVSVKNEEENIEAFLNGSDVGKDAEHGKLILAGGIPESGGNLEERSRNALTRIYEDGTIISDNVKVRGEIHATSGTFDNVHINGTIRTRWKLLKYKVLYYTSSSIEQWGFDGSAIYNDKIILVGGIGTPELLMAWGDDADGRELAICNRCVRLVSGTDLGVAVKVKVPTGKYIVGLDGTKVSGGNEFNIDGKRIYYMVGFNEGWYVTNILNLND